MKRRSRAGGKSAKTQRLKATTPKHSPATKAVRGRVFSSASEETLVARLTHELNEALEQQTATSEILQVISSSPGDLQRVFETMLAEAVRICDAKFGNIFRRDSEGMHLVARHNTPPAFAELAAFTPHSSHSGNFPRSHVRDQSGGSRRRYCSRPGLH